MRILQYLLSVGIFLLLSCTVFAIDYTYTGNGAWTDANNWTGGIIPPNTINGAGVVTITGNLVIVNCSNCYNQPQLERNSGTIIISPGGSLTLNNNTQFGNFGSIIVEGTLTSNTAFEMFSGNITVSGTFNNNKAFGNVGRITINGGTVNNTGNLDNTWLPDRGEIIVNCGGTIINSGILKLGNTVFNCATGITNSGTLSGNATISGNISNSGLLSPGNSPGTFTINGDYTALATAIHKFEVAGTASGSYDKLSVTGSVNLNGTLNVSLINGFVPATDGDLTIITGAINGTFSTVSLPARYILVYNSNSVALRHLFTLPVSLINFDVKNAGGVAKLTWKIEIEEDVLSYEVEKSNDGRNFTKIAVVDASAQNLYSVNDSKPGVKAFYRIKSVGGTGLSEYSNIAIFNSGNGPLALKIFPSPAQSNINVQHSTATKNCSIKITSVEGKLTMSIVPDDGIQNTNIDVSSMKPGIYFLEYKYASGNTETLKFLKQ